MLRAALGRFPYAELTGRRVAWTAGIATPPEDGSADLARRGTWVTKEERNDPLRRPGHRPGADRGLHRRRARRYRPRGQGGDRARGPGPLPRGCRPAADPGRARGLPALAVALRRPHRRRPARGVPRDPAPQGRALGDGGHDRPMWTAYGGQVDNSPRMTCHSHLMMR